MCGPIRTNWASYSVTPQRQFVQLGPQIRSWIPDYSGAFMGVLQGPRRGKCEPLLSNYWLIIQPLVVVMKISDYKGDTLIIEYWHTYVHMSISYIFPAPISKCPWALIRTKSSPAFTPSRKTIASVGGIGNWLNKQQSTLWVQAGLASPQLCRVGDWYTDWAVYIPKIKYSIIHSCFVTPQPLVANKNSTQLWSVLSDDGDRVVVGSGARQATL
jgi:hypothetical protein